MPSTVMVKSVRRSAELCIQLLIDGGGSGDGGGRPWQVGSSADRICASRAALPRRSSPTGCTGMMPRNYASYTCVWLLSLLRLAPSLAWLPRLRTCSRARRLLTVSLTYLRL